jgi:hypothetical protein
VLPGFAPALHYGGLFFANKKALDADAPRLILFLIFFVECACDAFKVSCRNFVLGQHAY